MAGEDKQLKIGVAVNDAELGKFKSAIREATIEVSKLGDQLNRAAKAFSGFLSGAKTSSGGGSFRSGNGFASAPKMGAGSITQPVETIANAIKGTAKGSSDALRSMESSTRSSTQKMTQDVVNLDRVLAGLERRFSKIKGVNMGGGSIPGLSAPGGGGFIPAGSKIATVNGVDTIVPSNYKAKSAGGGMNSFDDIYQAARRAVPLAMAGKGAQLVLREINNQPEDYMRQAVPLAGTFSGRGLGMMYGRDFHSLYSMMQLRQGPQGGLIAAEHRSQAGAYSRADAQVDKLAKHYGWSPEKTESQRAIYRQMHKESADGKLADNPAAQGLADWRGASGWARFGKTALDSIMGLDANIMRNLEGTDTAEKIRKDKMIDSQWETQKATQQARGISTFEQGWQGAVGTSRALHTSDPWTLEANLFRRGYNSGDLASAQGSIVGTGGLGTAMSYRDTAMRARTGGVDLGSLLGATAQAGGNPGQMGSAIGGYGVDAQAKSVIANALAQQTLSGGAMVNPGGMLSAFQAFNGQGQGAGEQMRVANAQVSGMGAINQNLFNGGVDNLQKGRNWVNAIGAAGDNLGGQNYLVNNMNFGMLAQLKQNPNANIRELQSVGLTNQQALKYGDSTMNSMFRNVGISGNNPMSQMAKEMMSGGFGSDFGGYLKSKQGTKGFDTRQALTTMGQMLQFEGFSKGDQQSYGMAADLAGLGNMSPLRKGGFADAAHGTIAAVAYDEVGKKKQEDARNVKNLTPDYVRKSVGSGQEYAEQGENVGKSAEEVQGALERLAAQVDVITFRLAASASRIKAP